MRGIWMVMALAALGGCSASVQLKSASSVPPPAPTPVAEPAPVESAPPPEVIVQNVEFDSARAQLKDSSKRLLDNLAAMLVKDTTIQRVDIDGHTDSRGTHERNLHLSVYRATAVRLYLIERGVAPERLVARGLGDERPISDNVTYEGRQLNRRVEFTIYRRSQQVTDGAVAAR